MSRPRQPEPARLFLSAIYSSGPSLDLCMREIMERFGKPDYSTRELDFGPSGYYASEMGANLKRRFYCFGDLADPARLAEIKLFTNELEEKVAAPEGRVVNIDPGLLCIDNLVLASGKPGGHRAYLRDGIYADIQLIYISGEYKPLPWTYPDYEAPEMREFLGRLREALRVDLREWRAWNAGNVAAADGNNNKDGGQASRKEQDI